MSSSNAHRPPAPVLTAVVLAILLTMSCVSAWAQGASALAQPRVSVVRVVTDATGSKLQVDGRDFMVFGMNWDYFPIGTNYSFSLWNEPDDVIIAALERDMSLMKSMGVNTIRQYNGVPPRWVEYIYEKWGIYTVLNHPMARYGFNIDGAWVPNVDYADPKLREAVKQEIVDLVTQFKDTRGVLMWLLGNENNYGLHWTSNEIEALPEGRQDDPRARQLYSLFDEVTRAIKTIDTMRPVAIANGDLQYIDIIAQECANLDILGTNVYRGISARDLYQVCKDKLGVPVMYTEFGADAWNAKEMREDQVTQAKYLIGQWQEIYEMSYGKGRVGNCIGGLTFQWTDGWWKFRQEERLEIHDTNASWPNAGYPEDYEEGENNMNEEWWGITAKGTSDSRGIYDVYPRAAYYALQKAYTLDPYAATTDVAAIQAHFATITPMAAALQARGDKAALATGPFEKARVSNLRMEFETYSTGGGQISTPDQNNPQTATPSFLGFDHMESFYVDFEVKPSDNLIGTLSVNILGNVPINPIDEIFYENRGAEQVVITDDGQSVTLSDIDRVQVYRASVTWDDRWFLLDAFYRTGHFHWAYQGDFFGLYPEANYGENIDIYNGNAPSGMQLEFKRSLAGLKVAFGPELWWGANPALLLKYERKIGPFTATAMYHEDLAQRTNINSTFAVPVLENRRASVALTTERGPVTLELGGLWSGSTRVGEEFRVLDDDGTVRRDEVRNSDTYGAKAKVSIEAGPARWYAQTAYMGIVALGGLNGAQNFTNWYLRDTGQGNQVNFMVGYATDLFGNFQFGPNFLYQKPLVGAIPPGLPAPARPRNTLQDPFAVGSNRETTGIEFVLSYDMTPATWMWQWDNNLREDARLAWSLGVTYRHQPTFRDASIVILDTGEPAAIGGVGPANIWEVRLRVVSWNPPGTRIVANFYLGNGQSTGADQRLVERMGMDARITKGSMAFEGHIKVDDWGPYDYHRNFNLTFPLQLMGDISHTVGAPRWFGFPQTRLGLRTTWRSLDHFSPRYCPGRDAAGACIEPALGETNGSEWEIRTYLQVSL